MRSSEREGASDDDQGLAITMLPGLPTVAPLFYFKAPFPVGRTMMSQRSPIQTVSSVSRFIYPSFDRTTHAKRFMCETYNTFWFSALFFHEIVGSTLKYKIDIVSNQQVNFFVDIVGMIRL